MPMWNVTGAALEVLWFGIITLTFLAYFVRGAFLQAALKGRLEVVRRAGWSTGTPTVLGFFHPYCNAGGGGERVLWSAIHAIQSGYPTCLCVVYTGDTSVTKSDIIANIEDRFDYKLDPAALEIVHLTKRSWVDAQCYPWLTLLRQSLGSVILGLEAIWKLPPDIFLDTMGYSFTYPIVKLLCGCPVVAYVHYPTISTDMLDAVSSGKGLHHTKSVIKRVAKLWYYRWFAWLYGLCGSFAKVVMVNSSWTKGHIDNLWKPPGGSTRVFPPCSVRTLETLPLAPRQPWILSLAQFRPEKNHALQLHSFARLLQTYSELRDNKDVRLIMIGGSRNAEDDERILKLKQLSKELGLEDRTEFLVNAPFSQLRDYLSKSTVGLHTMWNEHFGIGIVEYMAAGLIPVAHDSGGPKMDILVEFQGRQTGFCADSEEEYSQAMAKALQMEPVQRLELQSAARKSVQERFSEETFVSDFLKAIEPLLYPQ